MSIALADLGGSVGRWYIRPENISVTAYSVLFSENANSTFGNERRSWLDKNLALAAKSSFSRSKRSFWRDIRNLEEKIPIQKPGAVLRCPRLCSKSPKEEYALSGQSKTYHSTNDQERGNRVPGDYRQGQNHNEGRVQVLERTGESS